MIRRCGKYRTGGVGSVDDLACSYQVTPGVLRLWCLNQVASAVSVLCGTTRKCFDNSLTTGSASPATARAAATGTAAAMAADGLRAGAVGGRTSFRTPITWAAPYASICSFTLLNTGHHPFEFRAEGTHDAGLFRRRLHGHIRPVVKENLFPVLGRFLAVDN